MTKLNMPLLIKTELKHHYKNISTCSVLAKGWESGAPPLLGIQFSFDVVERM